MMKTNVLKQYDIFQNSENIPNLQEINQIDLSKLGIDDIAELDMTSDIIELVCDAINIYSMDSEHLYIVALGMIEGVKGIYLMGIGNTQKIFNYSCRNLILFLLLMGAKKCFTLHNHPNRVLSVSKGDKKFDKDIRDIVSLMEIECIGNFAVTTEGYINLLTNETHLFEGGMK